MCPSLFVSTSAFRFLQDLEHRLEEDILRFDVCDIVLHHCPALRKVYLPYVTNQAYQEQTYQRLLWVTFTEYLMNPLSKIYATICLFIQLLYIKV